MGLQREPVRGVHRALGSAGAHNSVQLIDEEDDLAFGLAHILEHGLEPLLELATVLGARHQRAHVQGDDAAAAHRLRDLAVGDALRQPLHHRRFAHTWLADEHWVVLAPPTEHLDRPSDLLLAT